jgi:hypothetical protein
MCPKSIRKLFLPVFISLGVLEVMLQEFLTSPSHGVRCDFHAVIALPGKESLRRMEAWCGKKYLCPCRG